MGLLAAALDQLNAVTLLLLLLLLRIIMIPYSGFPDSLDSELTNQLAGLVMGKASLALSLISEHAVV